MNTPTPSAIVATATATVFDRPLVTNVYRSVLSEAIVAAALPDWTWCSADYAAHDFVRDGVRLEVKQSALRQSWETTRPSKPSWDIAERKVLWNGERWIPSPGRNADIYVLALHAVADESADHQDATQWCFFVIAAMDLPATKRLGLAGAQRLTTAVPFADLRASVETIAGTISAAAHA